MTNLVAIQERFENGSLSATSEFLLTLINAALDRYELGRRADYRGAEIADEMYSILNGEDV